MATFSSSPAPRKSSRLQPRGSSPARRSRLAATPSFTNDGNSTTSAMDIDERASTITDRSLSRMGGDMLFAKTDEMSVLFYASLPLEVKQVLRVSDFKTDPYSGEIDTTTGFALVTSVQTCFVWQHAQALKGIPTCYIFACPQDVALRPPFHALVPQGSSREPGLILVSAGGRIRFWDSIGIGLAGGENFSASQLEDMVYDEEVTNLVRADAQTYILSTSYGRLYRLVLSSTGGKYHLTCRAFARPTATGAFSRLIPSFFASGSNPAYDVKDKAKHIHAVALGLQSANGDRQIWALANGRVQQWNMKFEGWEDILLEHDLVELLSEEVTRKFDVGDRDPSQDLELSDLAVFGDGNIALLISYSGKEVSDDFRRLYALAELRPSGTGFSPISLKSVPYQTTSQPGPPVHPRIQLIYGGSIVSVQFGDAVALCARDSEYRDRLELKSANDRTLGVGVSPTNNFLIILTATTMMKVSLELEKIQGFRPEIGRTNLIKSTMMQAILYGAAPVNPLRFSFPPDLNEDALMQGAEQLSSAVLRSDPEVVQQSPDMTAQLGRRKERLSWLISFINENAVLVKMSQRSRQQLATDAEKLYAAHQLWLNYNQFLSTPHSQSVLKDCVTAYMRDLGDNSHEDVMRAFFRSYIGDLGRLLKKVAEIVNTQARSPTGNVQTLLPEANRVVVTVMRSAFEYRTYNEAVYGVDTPMIKAWTSRPSIIDAVLSLFDLTTKAVETGTSRGKDKEPSSQLPALAAALFESIKERLDWLMSTGKDNQRDADELQQRFAVLRPEVLETLRRCGYEQAAFTLAEQYQDFASLVSLCHRETVYPPEDNPHLERIQGYIEKFKEDFTTELFQWYIQNGELRTMFEQEPSTSKFLDSFFRERPHPSISWIHDLGKERFDFAATALLLDADTATNLEAKQLMLSIGKLAQLSSMQETNDPDDTVLDSFHDGLDFISVHENLQQEFRSALASVRGRQSVDGQIETILKEKGIRVAGKPAFTHIFKDLLRQLLQGRALSTEDAVDLMTLKDNSESVEDYATSLHLLTNVKSLPEARRISAFRTVWRRVYLHDDWETLQKTSDVSDDDLNARYQETALYSILVSALQREDGPLVQPSEALIIPTPEEMASRWPGMSTDQIEALGGDYISEQDRLGDLELDDVFTRIHELAAHAVELAEDR
ncbi:hypothetical protein CPB83DRAFT_903494 [Crepidotus variabilis]|uniref:Uncharacterized protein n=1 Tax=Crepidotus variabilis TaxID=179855 RepID=A0A9P6EQB4_9AGAR|nr:hypothetical protein CPB83DRAFT_903494 [Crepidotus variabilis]